MRRATRMMLVTVTLFAAADRIAADPVSSAVTFQGQLKQDGKPVDGTCEFFFSLYDAETNGTSVADVGPATLDVTDGLFSVELDFGAAAFDGDARWIEIEVVCPPGGSMETLTPRQPVTAAPYALHALNAPSGSSLWSANGSHIHNSNTGNVGIGTTNPNRTLLVVKDVDGVADAGVRNPNAGTAAQALINVSADAASGALGVHSSNYSSATFRDRVTLVANTDASGLNIATSAATGDIHFFTGGFSSTQRRMTIDNTGRVGIGATAPTARLHVMHTGGEPVAILHNSNSFGDATGRLELGGNAGFGPAVQSRLTLESEALFAGTTASRIISDDDQLDIIAAGPIVIEADGDLTLATVQGGFYSLSNSTLPNIVAGSPGNESTLGIGSTISGGGFPASGFDPFGSHLVTDHNCTIGGGGFNQAGNDNADPSDARNATVAGGMGNTASGRGSSIGGGRFNTASGLFATVPGGFLNEATNTCSLAAGCKARANHHGSFVWSDAFPTDTGPIFSSSADNQFNVRANGGVRIASATHSTTGAILAGVQLAPGASAWSVLSDRNAKENFELADGRDTLERLAGVPIETWNYKTQDSGIRHMGPMAQDFYGAFGLGEDEQRISTIDADGVALSAIQGVYEIVQEKDAQIADLTARIEKLEAMMASPAKASIGGTQ